MTNLYSKVLDKYQQETLPKLGFLKDEGFYLAGGTALSLQIGHRTSVDFDFFVKDHFNSENLINKLKNLFDNKLNITSIEKDTVISIINNVDCSFFWLQYPLIVEPIELLHTNLASLEDICAMKLLAVSHRPAIRDYIDIYYLLQKFSLEEMFGFLEKKYKTANEYLILKALTYYDDLDENKNKRPIKMLDPNFSWEKAKTEILAKVKNYQLQMLKN